MWVHTWLQAPGRRDSLALPWHHWRCELQVFHVVQPVAWRPAPGFCSDPSGPPASSLEEMGNSCFELQLYIPAAKLVLQYRAKMLLLLTGGMSQCRWSDGVMSINKMWLRSDSVCIITNLFFVNYYIWAQSLLITRHTSFAAFHLSVLQQITRLDPASSEAQWRCLQQWYPSSSERMRWQCCEVELIP